MELARQLRERIASGQLALGTFLVELRSQALPHLLAHAGMDFFMIDTEHGCYDPAEVAGLIMAGKHAGICPIVRVSTPDRAEAQRALDAGAEGILFPMIRTMDEVRRAVAVTKYPPLGRRGSHMFRTHTGHKVPADSRAFNEATNRSILTAIQIETLESVELIEQIAATDGVDVLYLGPGDLGIELGHVPGLADPRVQAVVSRIASACRAHGKIAASHAESPAAVKQVRALGAQMVGVGATIRHLSNALRELTQACRQAAAQ